MCHGATLGGGQEMRILICGAHPDDPETSCGGLAAKYSQAGHTVVLVYFSCGNPQKQFRGRPHDVVREEECRAATQILGADVHFMGFEDGNTPMTRGSTALVAQYLEQAAADVVLTHWPVDTHPDHQATGNMALRCYLQQRKWALYFYEVMTGRQSLCFRPTDYVDITDTEQLKREACFCHESQDIGSWYAHHEQMTRWRGYEAGVTAAEALIGCPRGFRLPELLGSLSKA